MIEVSKRLEGIGEYYFSRKLREIEGLNKEGTRIINLGIGSPDLPPHHDVLGVLMEESAKSTVHAYQGYKGSPIFRKAISEWYNTWYSVILDPNTEILPLMGSKEGIMHISMTYLNSGDEVLVPNPGYPTYRSASQLAGAKVREYALKKENQWFPDFELLNSMDLSRVKILWVNYPHMPTGQLPTREIFEKLIQFARKNEILIVHDNPYSFILNEKPMSILSIPGALDIAIELNSLSKAQNMAGWRVGMLLGSQKRIEEILSFKSNMDSGMFLPIQLAAAKALSLPSSWYNSLNAQYRMRRNKAFELLKILNCSFDPSQAGMFVWAEIPGIYSDGFELSDDILYQSRVFITPGGIFGSEGNRFIRISLCSPEEIFEESIFRVQNSVSTLKFSHV
jgi:aspartate/methionine/tyrosine aminotransferase